MNAIVDPENAATSTTPGDSGPLAPRIYAGEGAAFAQPRDYVALLPADAPWERKILVRAFVADALQRNGQVMDEATLEAAMAYAQSHAGELGVEALSTGLTWQLQQGETRDDGRAVPPFHGYALSVSATTQRALSGYAQQWKQEHDAKPVVAVDVPLAQMKQLAKEGGQDKVLQTLDAIEAAIKAGKAASDAGEAPDKVALNAVLEFATKTGHEQDAAKILARYNAVKGVSADAKQVGRDAERVFNGRDPDTKKPLTTDQRVQSAFDLLTNGFKFVGDVGAAVQVFGIGGRFASSLIGIAPAGIAVVAFAAAAYELIKKAREAILAPQWDEFRVRFPGAEGMEPKQFVSAAMRQIAGMPTDADNALSTSSRILELLGENPDTRQRFVTFLKTKVEPDSLVDALATGKGLEGLSKEQAMQLAQASKGYSREFLQFELDDTKRFIKDRDGDRTRGTYLLDGEAKSNAERNTNKIGGTIDEALRIGGILVGSSEQVVGSFQRLLGNLKGGVQADGKPLDAQQQRNLAAATAAAAAGGGLTQVDSLLPSKDGTKLFAVQGDPQSESRRMVAIDIATAVVQDVNTSERLRTSALPATPVQSALQEQVQRAM